jgi:hypothetical protein
MTVPFCTGTLSPGSSGLGVDRLGATGGVGLGVGDVACRPAARAHGEHDPAAPHLLS